MRFILLSLILTAWPLWAQEKAASQTEVLDTSDAIPSASETPKPEKPSMPASVPETPVKKSAGPVTLQNKAFSAFTLGGTFQMKAFYDNMTAASEQDRQIGFSLSKFRLDLAGAYDEHFGLIGQFLLEANARELGVENAYAYFKQGLYQIQAGKLKKPFSMEALQSSSTLYTVDRGKLYSTFLATTAGYSLLDVGALFIGGFTEENTEVIYEIGVFNGKQSMNGYSGAQYETTDDGFLAKDFAGRIALKNALGLEAELALSVKSAESRATPNRFKFAADAAYEAGLAYERNGWRLQGELAWGANPQGSDSVIVGGSPDFLAFYAMLVRKQSYFGGRVSEAVVKIEGLDPSMSIGGSGGKPNDSKLRYTLGANYFFTPRISMLADYGILQPFTKVPGEGSLTQDFDVLWRLNF
jgi:hypothetical protein